MTNYEKAFEQVEQVIRKQLASVEEDIKVLTPETSEQTMDPDEALTLAEAEVEADTLVDVLRWMRTAKEKC